jgi:putative hemolysin
MTKPKKSALITPEEFASSLKLNKLKLNLLATPLMKLLKIDKLNDVYNKAQQHEGLGFIERGLKEFNVHYEVDPDELANLPKDRPFITVSNHPYGGIDGMILIAAVGSVRPDFKVMANYILQAFEEIQQYFISVNPFENAQNKQVNVSGIKTVLAQLKEGHPVGIFPAGEVSAFQTDKRKIEDREWHPLVGKIIEKAKVEVVPIYFSGGNSLFFNVLGLIHPNLRTARLPTEMFKVKQTVKVRIGKPVPYPKLTEFADTSQMLRYLRAKTYALGSSIKLKPFFFRNPLAFLAQPQPIVDPTPVAKLLADIEAIRPTDLLCQHQNYEVFLSEAPAIPHVLREIGRLREVTFREEGEGTNHSIDLDEYDVHYNHLFIWDNEAQRLVGAYRIGKGKDLYNKFKIKGFYLNELFSMSKRMAPILRRSLEMGRSFVVKDYQRKHISLMLLWKGVLVTLRRHPEYRYLIGPVSISNNFSNLSKELVVRVIKENYFDHELAKLVRPRRKFEPQLDETGEMLLQSKQFDIKELDMLIAEIESSHSKLPVLLKKYILQLNSKIIGFNIDPKFNNTLDGFIIMDLEKVPAEVFKMLDKEGGIS